MKKAIKVTKTGNGSHIEAHAEEDFGIRMDVSIKVHADKGVRPDFMQRIQACHDAIKEVIDRHDDINTAVYAEVFQVVGNHMMGIDSMVQELRKG